jgi:hypothetical protein
MPKTWAAVLKSVVVKRFLVSAKAIPAAVSALAWLPPAPDHPNKVGVSGGVGAFCPVEALKIGVSEVSARPVAGSTTPVTASTIS